MWKVTDGHTDEGRTMVNRPRHKLTWNKASSQLTIEDLKDCCCVGHHGYRNKMFLAILNLHVTPMSPTKFWLNLTYRSGADKVWRFSSRPSWVPSWILEWNNFSNSESLCCCDASHQVSAQSNLQFGTCHLKISKMAAVAALLDIGTEQF